MKNNCTITGRQVFGDAEEIDIQIHNSRNIKEKWDQTKETVSCLSTSKSDHRPGTPTVDLESFTVCSVSSFSAFLGLSPDVS